MNPPAPSTGTAAGPLVGLLSDSSFTQLVNEALRNYQSTLALSRSPLANSALVMPALVKDEASPTAEERGHGLRLVLQWAVHQLAPGVPTYALGEYRPLDDPAWRDPRWWRYNILRHRYLEPLHPDDFVEGGRFTESLVALNGISSSDAFFDERNRAIREAAERLRQQFIDGQANDEIQRMALREAMTPLEKQADAATLLGIAASFDDIFARSLLVEMAVQEGIRSPSHVLDGLIGQRYLLTGDEGESLWLSPVLRGYIYQRQPLPSRRRRHRWIAAHYETHGDDALLAARHWQRAEQDARAVRVLWPAVDELVHELQSKELIDLLQRLDPDRLEADQWYAVQLLTSDIYQRSGQQEEALAACRRALKASGDPAKQARIYRRMGKLYESHNQLHALRYYQQAVERFSPTDLELAVLLKDRGWVYFYRQEWEQAEHDLQQALQITPVEAKSLRGDIYDVMANLYRKTGHRGLAVAYAERALATREETGDLLRIAKSQTNLGLLYRAMGEFGDAITAYQEALRTYQKIGNQEMVAVALLNIGAAHFLNGKIDDAMRVYHQSLAICQSIGLPLIELKAHYNLAEALASTGQQRQAAVHWLAGYRICREHDFDDQEPDFLELRNEYQIPAEVEVTRTNGHSDIAALPTAARPGGHAASTPDANLEVDEQFVLDLAQRERSVTPKRLMHAANISRATATRRLTRLVEKGWLAAHGKGRGVYYALSYALSEMGTGAEGHSSLAGEGTDAVTIQTLLQNEQPDLAGRYAVVALGLVPPESAPHDARFVAHVMVRIVVRFAHLPDLPGYLALKQHLATVLHREVDLLPDFAGSPMPAPPGVNWIWQE